MNLEKWGFLHQHDGQKHPVPVALGGKQGFERHRHEAQSPVARPFLEEVDHIGQSGDERVAGLLCLCQRRVEVGGEDVGDAALERALGVDAGVQRAQVWQS